MVKSIIFATGAVPKRSVRTVKNSLPVQVFRIVRLVTVRFKDKDVCVVGGGNTAMEDALYLAGFCRKVYVINRSKKFRAAATMVENVKRNGKITVLTDTVVDKFVGSNMLEGVDIRNTVTDEKSILNVSGAIVAIGVKPSSDLAKIAGLNVVSTDLSRRICTLRLT